MRKGWLAALALALATPALAVDGVIEINQAKADAGGVTPGDAAGVPVTLSRAGSYVLTSDLFTSGANLDVIEITADHVTLDLNGFRVRCLFALTPCKGNGSGVGIDAENRSNVAIRNGTVLDIASDGIRAGSLARIEGVRALRNDGTGIAVGSFSEVQGSAAFENGGVGIITTSVSVVRGNLAVANGSSGFIIGPSSTVVNNLSRSNGGDGFSCPAAATFTGNLATGNTGLGLDAFLSSVGYSQNVFVDNNGGAETQVSDGTSLGHNFCGSDTVCP